MRWEEMRVMGRGRGQVKVRARFGRCSMILIESDGLAATYGGATCDNAERRIRVADGLALLVPLVNDQLREGGIE